MILSEFHENECSQSKAFLYNVLLRKIMLLIKGYLEQEYCNGIVTCFM